MAQRRVDRGDQEDREHEGLVVAEAPAEETSGRAEDEQVEDERGDQEGAVQQGAAEQPVDVDEVGPGDADRDRAGGDDHRHDQPHGADVAGQQPDREHEQHVDDRGPEQPAHPGAAQAGGEPVLADHDRERRQQAQRERQVGDPEQHRPRRVGQGQGDHVEVERAERRGQRAGPGGRLGHVRGGGDQGEGEQRRGDQPDEGERPPAADGQPAVGVEHEHERQHEEQPGAEALVDPERHRRARERGVGQGRVGQPGRREPVDGPPHSEDAEHPAERVPAVLGQDRGARPGEGQAGQAAGPAGLDRDRGAVRAGHPQVEHRRERRGGRGEQQEHRSRARAQRRRRHIEKRAVRSVPVSLGPESRPAWDGRGDTGRDAAPWWPGTRPAEASGMR